MSENHPEFDDPALKAALKRSLGAERAPDALRARIERSLRTSQRPPMRLFTPLMRIAAVLLIVGAGVVVWTMTRPARATIGPTMLADLVQRHDGCCAEKSHVMPALSAIPISQLGKTMGTMLSNTPVLAADLRGDGWTFTGPSICPCGGQNAAHLIFKRGEDAISVFSVPAKAGNPVTDGVITSYQQGGREIAAFVRGGNVYCMVCTSPKGQLKAADVKKLLEQHEKEIQQPGNATVALLHDIPWDSR